MEEGITWEVREGEAEKEIIGHKMLLTGKNNTEIVFIIACKEFPKKEFTQIKNLFFNYKINRDERVEGILKYCSDNKIGFFVK
jgi:hypothetical protein